MTLPISLNKYSNLGTLSKFQGDENWTLIENAINQLIAENTAASGLSVLEFGLVGDGSDETDKMQIAITEASNQNRTLVGDPSKTYKITGQLTGLSNCRMVDITLDASELTGTKHALVFSGAAGVTSVLTSNASAKAYSIAVTNGADFAADDWCLLTVTSSYYPYGNGSYNVARAEWVQIRSVSGNTLFLTTPLVQEYTTAAGATLRKFTFVENVHLTRVKVKGSGVAASNERGICFRYAKNFSTYKCNVDNIDQYAIEVNCSILGRIDAGNIKGTFYDGATGTIFYGVALVNACQYVMVGNNFGSRVRHLIVSTANSAGQGYWGQPMFILCHDNISYDSMSGGNGASFAYEVHGVGQHQVWANNIANGCYSFMRIEGGSDIQVIGGECTNYDMYGLILGGTGGSISRVTVNGLKLSGWTGRIANGAAIRFESSNLIEHVVLNSVEATDVCIGNTGWLVSVGTSTTFRGNIVRGLKGVTGSVENTGSATAFANGVAGGLVFENCDLFGWRTPWHMGNASKITVKGGSVDNYATGATGWAWYSNGDRNVCKDVTVRHINTAARCDTSSTNNLVVGNVYTDVSIATVSNGGTGNTVTPNYTV